MDRVKSLSVYYHDRKVGTLALYNHYLTAFEYDKEWIADGFSISPFSLPLEKKVFMPKIDPLDGLHGVFADSLPDGWGRLLVDRLMRKNGIDPTSLANLDRLAIVGHSGMGALTYQPEAEICTETGTPDLDEIAEECGRLLRAEYTENLDYLFRYGGSSGGARPKILTKYKDEDWIIKFPAAEDAPEIGKQEYDYAVCAVKCGLIVPEFQLFPSKKCSGYFGVKRFDRTGGTVRDRVHMVSAAGLLETSHRIPNLDYDLLMKLTLKLTGDMAECEKLYRLMCFNVFAHNRDDHSKNFSYLYLESEARWILSPAYDLTYSSSIGGEHATTVHGNGTNPGEKDLLAVAQEIGISRRTAKRIAEDIEDCVRIELAEYIYN